jgi:NADH:ubiquinone oxidoreductase subunit E
VSKPVTPIAPMGATKQRKRQGPKGRRVDAQALAEVQSLLSGPLRHDLLIEYLHKINDRYGQLGAPHLAALAALLGLAQTEVYEVATFYHHFDVVKESPDGSLTAPPALTVRVCDGLSCEMGGAKQLLQRLPGLLGRDVRVIPAPCVGRCEQAPVAVVHQNPVPHASLESVQAEVRAGHVHHKPEAYIDFDAYRAQGGYALLRDCMEHRRDVESVLKTMEDSGLRGLGGAGFPAGRKWRIVRGERAPRMMAVNIDEGEPGTFKDRWYLERDPHRFLEGMLIAAWAVDIAAIYIYLRDEYHGCRALLEAELAKLEANPPVSPLPKIGNDRIHRRQARHATLAPSLCRSGRPVRPADSGAQLRDAVLGTRAAREGRRLVCRAGAQRAQGLTQFLGLGTCQKPRREAGAGRHHHP